jgi:hypothetical protein
LLEGIGVSAAIPGAVPGAAGAAVYAVVCADLAVAAAAVAAGGPVLLIGDDAALLGLSAARLRAEGAPGCRVSVFVGDPSADGVWSMAATMAAEQFRSEVRIERPPVLRR